MDFDTFLMTVTEEYFERIFWKSLSRALQASTSLQDLRLGLDADFTGQSHRGVWSKLLKEESLVWHLEHCIAPLAAVFHNCKFPNLKKLHLEGLLVDGEEVLDVLVSYASSLKILWLNTSGLWYSDYYMLITDFRKTLKLKDFRIWGDMRQFYEEDFFQEYTKTVTGTCNLCPSTDLRYIIWTRHGNTQEDLANMETMIFALHYKNMFFAMVPGLNSKFACLPFQL